MQAPAIDVNPPKTFSDPSISVRISSLPSPFWKLIKIEPLSARCVIDRAASRVAVPLHCTSTISACLTMVTSCSVGSICVLSPPNPEIRRPLARIASICSRLVSTRVTSRPPSERIVPNSPPIPPAPTIATV